MKFILEKNEEDFQKNLAYHQIGATVGASAGAIVVSMGIALIIFAASLNEDSQQNNSIQSGWALIGIGGAGLFLAPFFFMFLLSRINRKMIDNEYYEISNEKLKEGIDLCNRNICKLLESTWTLMGNKYNHNPHSLGLYVFAIEEYGRLLYLLEMYRGNRLNKFKFKQLFGKGNSHSMKLKKAISSLDEKKCWKPIFGIIGVSKDGQESPN